jgi:hypothetical protein
MRLTRPSRLRGILIHVTTERMTPPARGRTRVRIAEETPPRRTHVALVTLFGVLLAALAATGGLITSGLGG